MCKVVTIVGARPQFIKASAVSRAIAGSNEIEQVLVHTGQHFDTNMSDRFFGELSIDPPLHHLNIHGGTHGAMTGRMLVAIEEVLVAEKPDAVLVYGDTNSTLAGALAAAKLHIPVAHVEAGLRSFNMRMPEEINRILTDRISTWLFTPTETAIQNLRSEGVPENNICLVGDVMYDVALHYAGRVEPASGSLASFDLEPGNYVLATIHRAENTDDLQRLQVIVNALSRVSLHMPVVWPLHPRTRGVLEGLPDYASLTGKVELCEPVGYLDMVQLERFAAVIATDSGGIQKEAFFHKVPCVTLRDETEWTELVGAGWNRLAPPLDAEYLACEILAAKGRVGQPIQPYGDGAAAEKIVAKLAAAGSA